MVPVASMTDTARRESAPTRVLAAYSAGYLGVTLITQVLVQELLPFYYPPAGSIAPQYLGAGAAGLMLAVGRVLDAAADPLVGIWSDNTRSRLGRRRPFILAGTLPMCWIFILLFYPPVASVSPVNFWWGAGMAGLFFIFYTIVVGPYLALLPALARTARDRVRLTTFQALWAVGALVIAFIAVPQLKAAFGAPAMAMVVAALTAAAFFVAASQREPAAGSDPVGFPLLRALRETLGNPVFAPYIAGQSLLWFASTILQSGAKFMVTGLAARPEEEVSIFLGASLVVAVIVGFPAVNLVARRLGPTRALLGTMLGFGVACPMIAMVGIIPGDPALQLLIVFAAAGLPLAGFLILPNAVLAAVTDIDEERTGKRREAMYFGTQGLIVKLAIGASSVVIGALLSLGASPGHALGIRLLGLAAGIAAVGAFFFLRRALTRLDRIELG
jgi:GPH family glycoside/pentoside/hexuronide:cation symporter